MFKKIGPAGYGVDVMAQEIEGVGCLVMATDCDTGVALAFVPATRLASAGDGVTKRLVPEWEGRVTDIPWALASKPKDGLFNKFSVFRNRYEECDPNDPDCPTPGNCEVRVYLERLTRPSMVLVPFAEDGSVSDPAAIVALKAYADACDSERLRRDIYEWINGVSDFSELNVPQRNELGYSDY